MARRSRLPNLKNLNPVFHKRDKSEDDNELSRALIKQARKSGILSLSGRGLASVPEKVWNINESEKEVDLSMDLNSAREDAWWNQQPLYNLDLSSNTLTTIPSDIGKLHDLTILDLHDNALISIPKEIGQLEKLTKINLCRNKLKSLPIEFFRLQEIRYLNLAYNEFEEIHPDISDLHILELLDLSNNQLTSLPGGIGFLVHVTEFRCAFNNLKDLPDDLVDMRSLQKLDLMNNDLEHLPSEMGGLRRLVCLYVQHNNIKELPNFEGCTALKELHISNNYITKIEADFCDKLPQLQILDLRDNKIEKLPNEIALLQSLIRLDLSNNSINSLPNSLSSLAHLISLQLEGNPIRSIRRDIIQCGTNRILKTLRDRSQDESNMHSRNGLFAEDIGRDGQPDRCQMRMSGVLAMAKRNLADVPEKLFQDAQEERVRVIDLSKNKFTSLPVGLKHVENSASDLLVAQNLLESVPSYLSQFTRLVRIDFSRNLLNNLPQELGELSCLRELNIANNKFEELPKCIYNMKNLEILLAKDNQIQVIDATPTGLGALKRLAVLNLSNNNISHVPPILGNLTSIVSLNITGNRFRQPRHQILEKGTEAIMAYLRDRIPV